MFKPVLLILPKSALGSPCFTRSSSGSSLRARWQALKALDAAATATTCYADDVCAANDASASGSVRSPSKTSMTMDLVDGIIAPMRGADQEKPADLLVLSPHFDDAALSCGGLIARTTATGGTVVVATVMAAAPHHLLNRYARAAEACAYVATRIREDEAAMCILGASRALGPFTDCIYRLNTAGTHFAYEPRTVLGGSYAGELGLVDEVAAWLGRFHATRVLAPAAAGGHVDHVLVRDAALAAFPSVDLYEDYPYAATRAAEAPHGWRVDALREPLDAADLAAKVRAISAYASQLPMLFAGADVASLLENFAARDGDRIERYWRAAASTSGG